MSHIPDKMFFLYQTGQLKEETVNRLLEHAGQCDFCALRFSNSFSDEYLLKTPVDFKKNVIAKSKPYEIQMQQSIRWQLFAYTVRVSIATCATLFFLAVPTMQDFNLINKNQSLIEQGDDFVRGWNSNIESSKYHFRWNQTERYNKNWRYYYDKKEK